jgi:Zn-dependent protease with chaperone function
MDTLYPPKPGKVNPAVLAPSAAFKKEVGAVVAYIACFFVVYLLLVAAAVALAAGCVYAGFAIIVAAPRFITIIIGLGLVALGISVVFFLVKFVFAVQKGGSDTRIEITEEEQPRLFAFIRRLTDETQTPFPKKIFLSPEVNACVFYNSSFWSMFLPVKKNLEIGVGLVNVVNLGEFKAVMAHEFGHFSQRSMKLGSFTYNVNRIIYNMLYDNNSYTGFLSTWGNLHGVLSIFAAITVKIAQAIQWILKQMYALINKGYMGLSREMEFHADGIAAAVAGSNNMITALNRVTLGDSCYQAAVARVNESLPRNEATVNLFADQSVVLRFMEKETGADSSQATRINVKDQWASHPSMEERTAHLQQLDLDAEVTEDTAWSVFEQPQQLQKEMTQRLYTVANIEATLTYYNEEQFAQRYITEKEEWQLPEKYMEWFGGRYPAKEIWEQAAIRATQPLQWEKIVNEENIKLPGLLSANQIDLQMAEALADKRIEVKSFDFDGQKYKAAEAAHVVNTLKKEIEQQQQELNAIDLLALQYLFQQQPEAAKAFREANLEEEDFAAAAKVVIEIIAPFYKGEGLTLQYINTQVDKLIDEAEPVLKQIWEQLLFKNRLQEDAEMQEALRSFISKHRMYWQNNAFVDEELNELYSMIKKTDVILSRRKFVAFRKWLEQTV